MEYKILDKVNYPEDIKKLSFKELNILAEEIRDFMVDSVSKTGGHLASSLGAVELTLAIFKTFSPPDDKIIWDVGHQAYTHKILTGRKNKFHTLRQYKGISGFLKPSESIYDVFGAGHSSTSISVAAGIAKARDLKNKNYEVVAIIGDAALANGMAFEAINNIGHDKTNVLIIVLDNEMSISPTVGALSEYFNNIISGKFYNKLRDIVKTVLDKIPGIGSPVANIIKHFEEAIKGVISPGIIFEELGFKYFGPINGHNIKLLVDTLNNIKDIKEPKILHVITKKGKGYKPAEENPTLFHGVSSFDKKRGEVKKGALTYSKVFSETLVEVSKKQKNIVSIVAAMVEGTNLTKFKELFPNRFFDVGIAEEHAVTFAAGLAKEGFKPFVSIYSTFLQRSVDQIIHDVGIHKLPVVFAMDRAGLVGEDGATHHGVFDIVFMKMIPDMIIVAPSETIELKRAVLTAAKSKKPFSIRFPRGKAISISNNDNDNDNDKITPFKIGKGRLIKSGKTLTIVNLGALLVYVLDAVREVENKKKISIEVIDARFAKPFDKNLILKSVKKTKRILTIEEGVILGGFGESVIKFLKDDAKLKNFKAKILGIPDKFIEHGKMEQLRKLCNLTTEGIIKSIYEII